MVVVVPAPVRATVAASVSVAVSVSVSVAASVAASVAVSVAASVAAFARMAGISRGIVIMLELVPVIQIPPAHPGHANSPAGRLHAPRATVRHAR